MEIKALYEQLDKNAPDPTAKPITLSGEYIEVASRLVALGEQVGQALVWGYLVEPERVDPLKVGSPHREDFEAAQAGVVARNGDEKRTILMRLRDDPDLSRWLVPLLRVRMAWFEQAIDQGHFREVISTSEIAGIEGYLYAHGTSADIEQLNEIVRRLRQLGFAERTLSVWLSPEEQLRWIAMAKENLETHASPFISRLELILKTHGVILEARTSSGAPERASNQFEEQGQARHEYAESLSRSSTDFGAGGIYKEVCLAVVGVSAVVVLLWLLLKWRTK